MRWRIAVLVFLFLSLLIFIFLNRTSLLFSLSLTFFGYQTGEFPLILWIFGGIAMGWITSIGLQLLNAISTLGQKTVTANKTESRSSRFFRSDSSQVRDSQPLEAGESKEVRNKEWEKPNRDEEDWNIEEPPREPTIPRRNLEEPQQSKPKADTVYSYGYQEPQNTGVGKTEKVYDADYRVIKPPVQPSEERLPDEDQEDWGFEDEELEENR